MKRLLIAFMLITMAATASPLDLLTWKNSTPGVISLSGLDPISAWAIDSTNPNLTTFVNKPLPDIGRYFTGIRELANGQAGVPTVLINFTKGDGEITPSVDTNPANDGNENPVDTSEDEGLIFP
jgi:hypothetical protein